MISRPAFDPFVTYQVDALLIGGVGPKLPFASVEAGRRGVCRKNSVWVKPGLQLVAVRALRVADEGPVLVQRVGRARSERPGEVQKDRRHPIRMDQHRGRPTGRAGRGHQAGDVRHRPPCPRHRAKDPRTRRRAYATNTTPARRPPSGSSPTAWPFDPSFCLRVSVHSWIAPGWKGIFARCEEGGG